MNTVTKNHSVTRACSYLAAAECGLPAQTTPAVDAISAFGRGDRISIWLFAVVVVGAMVGERPALCASPEPAARDAQAAQQVRAALRLEALGDATYRKIVLDVALNHFGDYPPSRWHNGQVEVDGEWLTLAEAESRAARDERLAAYAKSRVELRRNSTAVEGSFRLGKWCLEQGLDDRARCHFAQVLLAPATAQQRQAAAKMLASLWRHDHGAVDPQAAQLRRSREAWRQWAPVLKEIAPAFAHGDHAERERALAALEQASDTDAIPALEALVSADSEAAALAVVELLAAMPQHEATLSLARHAVYSPSEKVREAAAERLVNRPLHDYAPWLLSCLASPLKSRYWIDTLPNGTLRYMHNFYREGENRNFVFRKNLNVATRPTNVMVRYKLQRVDVDGPLAQIPVEPEQADELLFGTAFSTEMQVAAENQRARRINRRIDAVLSRATGRQRGADPVQWWEWWHQYNELQTPDRKPTVVAYSSREFGTAGFSVVHNVISCFRRGTTVWTESGAAPIETIRVGDRVLSQDVDTGELSYKTVLATTVRRPAPLLTLRAGGSEVAATRGHPFWVSGHGWKMAKFLAEGDNLHCADGFVPIESIVEAPPQETYNLIVEDFATYFVGERRLLVHDNTLRQPTLAIVPGLARK